MADWPISQRLKDYLEVQYELRRVLGEGGMGVVLLATERVLDRPVAIKVLHRHAAEQPEMRERFRREARVAARLTHANIVPLHTFGDIDGELFFVMGFVEGETLAERLRREGQIPQDDALRILREVCDALALAHANGVIHRDIKPENVLLEARTGRALLADFGIAREGTASAALTGTGIAIGTPHYMSPEQAASDGAVDHRADIYAVGVLGYRMLSGRLPFDGANVREILAQQMVATPRDFAREHPEVSPQVAAAIMRCLEKNPALRWPDVASVRDAMAQPNDAEEVLPRRLAEYEGGLPWTVFGCGVFAWLLTLNRFWWHNDRLVSWTPLVFTVVAGGLALSISIGVRHGWMRTLSVLCRPPKWWTLWWPRFARRPGDVWDRLPRLIRWGRAIALGSIYGASPFLATFMLMQWTLTPDQLGAFSSSGVTRFFLPGALVAGAIGGLSGVILLNKWWRTEAKRAVVEGRAPWGMEPVASPRWKRPEFARFLLPQPSANRSAPETADHLGSAISQQVQALLKDGVVQSGAPADVARDVVHAIAAIDRELTMLEKGGDAAEMKRLNDRIEAAAPGGMAKDIVEMLSRQRDAVREILHRQGEQRHRRERLMARLRELFLVLDEVRQRANVSQGDDITGRIDLVCSDLRRLAAGYDDLRDFATTPFTSQG